MALWHLRTLPPADRDAAMLAFKPATPEELDNFVTLVRLTLDVAETFSDLSDVPAATWRDLLESALAEREAASN